MEKKIKIITATCIGVIGVIGGCTYFFVNQNKLDNNNQVQDTKNPVNDNNNNNLDNNFNNSTNNNNDNNTNIDEPDDEINKNDNFNNSSNLKPSSKPNNNSKPIVNKPAPENPPINNPEENEPNNPPQIEEPSKPSEEEKLEDLIITNDMVQNGIYKVNNQKYNSITISANIDSNSKIVLDTIEINNGLVLVEPNNYQLDIINSNITSLTTNKQILRTYAFRKSSFNSMNKSLEGATINLQNGSKIETAVINNNIEINGENTISNVTVNDANEVILNVPIQKATFKTSGLVSVNQTVDMLTNGSADSTIIVNGEVNTFMNNEQSTIRINNGNIINNFYNLGENTIVSGTGSINSAIISASNTRIYTPIVEKPIVEGENDNILIRSENENRIESAISTSQGSVTFTLSKAVNLTIKDLSVICNAGKSITLYNLSTSDNKTYTLTTSYFKNDSYALYLTLPNGNIISKDFDTDYANPTVNKVVVERTTETTANLELYGVDEGGYIYYILEDVTTREALTPNFIKENGQKGAVKVGYNAITINNLEPNKSYNLYYVIEGYFENISKEKGPFNIPGEVVTKDPSNYQIVSASEEMSNRFVFTLNKVPDKKLTLEDFEIICPTQKNLTIKGAKFITSPDLLTYIIIVPDNYGHKDNKYTVKIQISDTEKIESSFVSHFDPPAITGAVDNVKRVDENTAIFNFNSDEAGIVYYEIYEWNGGIYDYNSSTPFANDVIENVKNGDNNIKQQALNAGPNTITLDLTGYNVTRNTRVWALFVDYDGNYRTGFVDHYKIPETIDVPDETENELITNLEVRNNKYITIDFKETIGWVSSDDIELAVISGGSLPAKLLYSIDNDTPKKLSIEILNYVLTAGEYELKLHVLDKNEKPITLTKKIVIN